MDCSMNNFRNPSLKRDYLKQKKSQIPCICYELDEKITVQGSQARGLKIVFLCGKGQYNTS